MRKLTFLILLSFSFSFFSLCCFFSSSFFFLLLFIRLLLLLIPFSSSSSSRENQESTRIEKKHEPLPKNFVNQILEDIKVLEKEKENELLKHENKIEQQKENLKELKKVQSSIECNKQINPYLQEICQKYGKFDNFIKQITKSLPENVNRIVEEGFSQFIIGKTLQEETNIYNYMERSPHQLMEITKHIWENLRINEEITSSNFQMVVSQLLEELKQLKDYYQIDIFTNLKDRLEKSDLLAAVKTILNDYTGSAYININKALTSKNPILLSKMATYLNIVAKNNQNVMVGERFETNNIQKVYRNIFIKRGLVNLYKLNQIIFFTNLTSTSKKRIFKRSSTPTHANIEFEIKLLNVEQQRKNKFFPAIDICKISTYQSEEEILLTPYQLFIITNVTFKKDEFIIELEEIDNKELIMEIMKPKLRQPVQNLPIPDLNSIKKILSDELKTIKEKIDLEVENKAKIEEKFKTEVKEKIEKFQKSIESDQINNIIDNVVQKYFVDTKHQTRGNLIISEKEKSAQILATFAKNTESFFTKKHLSKFFDAFEEKITSYPSQKIIFNGSKIENLNEEETFTWATNVVKYIKDFYFQEVFLEERKKLEVKMNNRFLDDVKDFIAILDKSIDFCFRFVKKLQESIPICDDDSLKNQFGLLLFKLFYYFINNNKDEIVEILNEMDNKNFINKEDYKNEIESFLHVSFFKDFQINLFGKDDFFLSEEVIYDSLLFFSSMKIKIDEYLQDVYSNKIKLHFTAEEDKAMEIIKNKTLIKLIGCQETCPYCGVKCNLSTEHEGKHIASKHRLMGLTGSFEFCASGEKVLLSDLCDSVRNIYESSWKELHFGLNVLDAQANKAKRILLNERLAGDFNSTEIGKLSITLDWYDPNDLDLHLTCPCGTHVFFGNKTCANCTSTLDIDMNTSVMNEKNPAEHITSPNIKNGKYEIEVVYQSKKNHNGVQGCDESKFNLTISNELKELRKNEGVVSKNNSWKTSLTFAPGITFHEHLKNYYNDSWQITANNSTEASDDCLCVNYPKVLTKIEAQLKKMWDVNNQENIRN